MKPKRSYTRGGSYDNCQTPPYAVRPLLRFVSKSWRVWEPAQGRGNLANEMRSQGYEVIGSDLQSGQDFYTWQPERFDCIITNPPYSDKYRWLQRCIELGKPFALLVPVEMLGAQSALKYLQNLSFEMLLFWPRVNFDMPQKGYTGGGAQFPTFWLTSGILPERVVIMENRP